MKVTYNAQLDVLVLVFRDTTPTESDESTPGIIIDYDAEGGLVAMEILDASRRVSDPRAVEYAITGLPGGLPSHPAST